MAFLLVLLWIVKNVFLCFFALENAAVLEVIQAACVEYGHKANHGYKRCLPFEHDFIHLMLPAQNKGIYPNSQDPPAFLCTTTTLPWVFISTLINIIEGDGAMVESSLLSWRQRGRPSSFSRPGEERCGQQRTGPRCTSDRLLLGLITNRWPARCGLAVTLVTTQG